MTDDEINAIVHRAANWLAQECGEDPDAVINACFGLTAHCVTSFGITNDAAHQAFASLLAQRIMPSPRPS